MRPFRFGVQTHGAATPKEWRELARKAESLGYSSLLMPDHFGNQWGPVTALTVAAEATETLRVGALVFDNDYRHPVVLAKEMATLDLISDGRLEFGLGAGWMKTDYESSGIPLDRAGVRIERMREGLAIMKALWTEGRCTFAGRHYQVTGAEGAPLPVTRPHPPVCIGGGGRRVLSIAAREADIVGFNASLAAGEIGPEVAATALPERFDERVEWVREAAGARFGELELQCHTSFVIITDDRRATAEAMAPLFAIDPDVALEIPVVLAGTVDQLAEDLVARRERWGFTYWVIQADAMEAFAPVLERVAGR